MCWFHRWEEEARAIGAADEYLLWKHVGEVKLLLIVERCAKCGKRRAYTISMEVGSTRSKVDVHVAEELLRRASAHP